MLGYPDAGLADAEHAIRYARKIGQPATLLMALAVYSFFASLLQKLPCGFSPIR